MLQNAWNSFPQQIVQKINSLLEDAEPSPTKAFQLYKMCQSENLYQDSFNQFSNHLSDFFRTIKSERSKSVFDNYLIRPMDCVSFEAFHLTFRTAAISSQSVRDIASWAHHMLRLNFKSDLAIFSIEAMYETVYDLTHPSFDDKDQDIEFEDFCSSWSHAGLKLFGKRFEAEQVRALSTLHELQQQHQQKFVRPAIRKENSIYLTQTEIDWTAGVQKAADMGEKLPRFPLSRGPEKDQLIELVKCATLYEIAFSSDLPRLVLHREQIRATVISRCDWLLKNCRI